MPNMKDENTLENELKKGIGTVILVEDTDRIQPQQSAQLLSDETGFPIVTAAFIERSTRSGKTKSSSEGKVKGKVKSGKKSKESSAHQLWQLAYTSEGLALRLSNEPSWGDIRVDFASSALAYRKQHGGGRNEAIAKAIGIKGKQSVSVIDCTAGMGNDSFVMASVGANVTMLERSPVIAALLEDALNRIQDPTNCADADQIGEKLSLVKADASDYLKGQNTKSIADVIYLDPMFPHKKKSALVKKEMRAFQQLLGADMDSSDLLQTALNYAGKRVVVKRPSHAQPIELNDGRQPDTAIESKKHRFDVYLLHC